MGDENTIGIVAVAAFRRRSQRAAGSGDQGHPAMHQIGVAFVVPLGRQRPP